MPGPDVLRILRCCCGDSVTLAGVAPRPAEDEPMLYLFPFVAIAIGGAAMVAGEVDDAPGLVLMGLVLVVGAIAHAVNIARRSR